MKATFEADFSTFKNEVDAATVKLRGFEAESGSVSTALSKMVDQFSGRKVIEEATLMAAAVEKVGGAAVLSTKELDAMAATAGAAADKFLAFGQEVPASLTKLIASIGAAKDQAAAFDAEVQSWEPQLIRTADTTERVGQSFTVLNQGLRAAGLGGGAALGDLENLTRVATGAAGAMGTLGTAVTAVGGALAAWKIGNVLATWAEQETIITRVT